MKYALIIFDVPKTDSGSTQVIASFANNLLTISEQKWRGYMLNIGAFLLPLENGLSDLGTLVELAKERRLPTRTIFFEDKPSFIVTKI